jgi:hypothetical protein
MHAGVNTTLTALRKTYWIPKGRITAKQTIRNHCKNCRIFSAKPFATPKFPQLPASRTVKAAPFENTGVDLFGPIRTKEGKGKQAEKTYVAIFTCMVTRAVHLEIVNDLTAAQFLESFQRFIARRGLPKEMWSDNGTNLTCTNNFRWMHITPLAPWRGGFYERLIRIIKDSIKRTIGKKILGRSTFTTVITQIEAMLNNRPLTTVTENLEDTFTIIRPVDFLRPANDATDTWKATGYDDYENDPTYFEKLTTKTNLSEMLQIQKSYLEKFWQIWHDQYLTAIRERQRSIEKSMAIQGEPILGESVLIESDEPDRNQWKVGVVDEIIRSEDGVIRTLRIKTGKKTTLLRAINQIYPLEAESRETDNTTKTGNHFQSQLTTN